MLLKNLAVASSGVFHSIKFVHFENYAIMLKGESRIFPNVSLSETSINMFEKKDTCICMLDLLRWLLGLKKRHAR